jgi:hypothetical protein
MNHIYMKLASRLAGVLLGVCIAPVYAQDLNLHAVLDGATVVSATTSKATGEATAVLRDDGKVRINLVFGGLTSNVTGAALHTGTKAENGPKVMPLDVRKDQTVGSLSNSELTLTPDVVASMRNGDTYIVVTTIDYPSGAIRGQLMPQPVRLETQPAAKPSQ